MLVTSHNRKEQTLTSLQSLFAQRGIGEIELIVFLVDDGSSDGTSDAIAAHFPQVRLIRGDGNLYWGGGMRKAFGAAMEEGFDAYLWLNDDARLYDDALSRIVICAESAALQGHISIVTGSMCDSKTGSRSYGGYRVRTHGLHLQFEPAIPNSALALHCDTVNGNLTLIPASIALILGNLDGAFRHQRGDLDYGLRAKKAGFSVLVGPGYFGECIDDGRIEGTWRDQSQPFRKRWENMMSPKGMPFQDWLLFTHRHFGWRWPIYAISPYIKLLLKLD